MEYKNEDRPEVWVGHVFLKSNDVPATTEFLKKLGVRVLVAKDKLGVLEVRAGTHIVLQHDDEFAPGLDVDFDLMVDDLEAARKRLQARGLEPEEIIPGNIHDRFFISDPPGNRFRVLSTHATDLPL